MKKCNYYYLFFASKKQGQKENTNVQFEEKMALNIQWFLQADGVLMAPNSGE